MNNNNLKWHLLFKTKPKLLGARSDVGSISAVWYKAIGGQCGND